MQPCHQDVLAGALSSHLNRMARRRRPVTAAPGATAVQQVTTAARAAHRAGRCATLDSVSAHLLPRLVARLHVDLKRTSSAVCSTAR